MFKSHSRLCTASSTGVDSSRQSFTHTYHINSCHINLSWASLGLICFATLCCFALSPSRMLRCKKEKNRRIFGAFLGFSAWRNRQQFFGIGIPHRFQQHTQAVSVCYSLRVSAWLHSCIAFRVAPSGAVGENARHRAHKIPVRCHLTS